MENLKASLVELLEAHETSAKPLADYDEIWFFGDLSNSFSLRAPTLADKLGNFAGIVASNLSAEKRLRISGQMRSRGYWAFIDFESIVERARTRRLLLVDFNDTLAGRMFGKGLRHKGVEVCDYLRLMNDLRVHHTYLPVNEERDYFVDHLDDFLGLAGEMQDSLSRDTLIARVKTFITLDRGWLIEVSQPLGLFTRAPWSHSALVVSGDEIYVDIGAAHGDTVAEFFNACGGNYREIHAFEPDSFNFNSLSRLCKVLPNAHCYQQGLSDENGELAFHEDPDNRFGSNFTLPNAGRSNTQAVKISRLDDVVNEATVMKMDVEGFEQRALQGAERIIGEQGPSLHVSGYHYPNDLLSIFSLVRKIRDYPHVAIRHYGSTLYDTNMLFSTRQTFLGRGQP